MNKKLLLCVLLMLFVGIKAQAYTWTDENGVTWTFNQTSFNVNGENHNWWYIYQASDYGESVTIPSVVYNGDTPCTIEAVGYEIFNNSKIVTNVVIPATIKYIYNSSYGQPFSFNSGTIWMQGDTPPVLTTSGCFGGGVTILVPEAGLDAYRNSNQWSDIAVRIISQSEKTDYNINVTAQSNMSAIHQVIGESNLGNVMSLKLTGSINSYDIMIMRNKMHNLHDLDMTNVAIKACDYEFSAGHKTSDNTMAAYAFSDMVKLMTVKLPNTITKIEDYAFANCRGLKRVDLQDAVTAIGNFAFADCRDLRTINFNEGLKSIGNYAFGKTSGNEMVSCDIKTFNAPTTLKSIGSYAFSCCKSLTEVNLNSGLETIADRAFQYCTSLSSIVIPEGIKVIEYQTFYNCSVLENVSLPSTLETIGAYAFSYCKSLTTISLPARLQVISNDAFFYSSALKEIRIPSSVRSVGSNAFSRCNNLLNVYACTLEPITINENTFSTWTTATLHVPFLAYYNYYYDTQWGKFSSLVMEDLELSYFYVNNDYTFTDHVTTEVDEAPDVDLEGGAGIVIENSTSTVTLGDVHMKDNGTTSGSIVAKDNLTVKNLFFDMTVAANKWYFLSLPFRVKQTNVKTPGDYIFRYYDGATRAANGSGGWKNYSGEYLEAHTGYIFQTNTAGTLTFQVEPADMDFSSDTRQNAMATHAAENAKNASWNFMGNPFPSYFDIDDTGYDAPITVWNGSSYIAVRPGDDQYHLGPFQAFFVQKPEALTSMEFPHSGCHTYNQWAGIVAGKANAPRRAVQQNRQLVNLTIGTDETVADRTRVVFNGQKTTAYELDCDAAKFLSSESVAQLYSLDDQLTSYAINERPMGEVRLGYVAAQNGMLTITAERMDKSMLLYDKQMNIYHDLTAGGYMFSTDAGTFNDRFVLTVDGSATAISRQSSADTHYPTDVYSLGGTHVSTDGTDRLSTGTYVVKQGNVSTKVIVK